MIKLVDLIALSGVSLGRYKIHCATGAKPTPLEAFYEGTFRQWQEYQNQENFKCDTILSLIHLGAAEWLFAGAYKVDGVQPKSNGQKTWYQYFTTELSGLEHLTGRVIVNFAKSFRASYLRGTEYGEQLTVKELKPERQSIGDFPGYHLVLLPFNILKIIVRQQLKSWQSALDNVAGVYLIVDTTNGKQYVGSAYGEDGIWHRWSAYAETAHGGNKELKNILASTNDEYASNFRFSLLEIIDKNASKEYVIARECHWKEMLLTREFGYNHN